MLLTAGLILVGQGKKSPRHRRLVAGSERRMACDSRGNCNSRFSPQHQDDTHRRVDAGELIEYEAVMATHIKIKQEKRTNKTEAVTLESIES